MKKIERMTVSVKVLPAHKEALERIAQQEDTSAAAIMRRLIRREALSRGVWPASPASSSAPEQAVRP